MRYPDADYPYTFYFNGHPLPRWAASWSLAQLLHFVQPAKEDELEILDIYWRIDHVGNAESAEPDVFLCVIQEVLLILLRERVAIQACLRADETYTDPEIYTGLLEGAFAMRRIVLAERRAFWTSGYEADRLNLLATMDACALNVPTAATPLPPHLRSRSWFLDRRQAEQARDLRGLSHDKTLAPELRARLQHLFPRG